MKLYKISCHSKYGTYFASYLQSVTVVADSPELALASTRKWLAREGRSFINNDSSKWSVEVLANDLSLGVVDWHEDSDY